MTRNRPGSVSTIRNTFSPMEPVLPNKTIRFSVFTLFIVPDGTPFRNRSAHQACPGGAKPRLEPPLHSDQGAKDDGRIGAKARERSRKHDIQDGQDEQDEQDEQDGHDGSLLRRDGGGASTTLEGVDLSCKG